MYGTYAQQTSPAATSSNFSENEALALVRHLDKDQLQGLLNDDSKLEDLVRDLLQTKQMESDKETLVISNKSLAEYNLSIKPKLDDLKTTVATGYEQINKLKNSLGEEKAKLDMHCGRQKLDTMLALLQTQAAQAEEESEQLADAFIQQEMSVDAFIQSYLSKRTIAHLRKVKAEKMAEIIRNQGTNHYGPMSPSSGSTWQFSPPAPVSQSAPYPVNPSFHMPQPSFYGH